MLLIGLIGAVAIPFSLILAGTSTGLITYADYSERCTKRSCSCYCRNAGFGRCAASYGCEYLMLDKNYQVTETTLEGDDLDRLWNTQYPGR